MTIPILHTGGAVWLHRDYSVAWEVEISRLTLVRSGIWVVRLCFGEQVGDRVHDHNAELEYSQL
jgi:hypothetical protein